MKRKELEQVQMSPSQSMKDMKISQLAITTPYPYWEIETLYNELDDINETERAINWCAERRIPLSSYTMARNGVEGAKAGRQLADILIKTKKMSKKDKKIQELEEEVKALKKRIGWQKCYESAMAAAQEVIEEHSSKENEIRRILDVYYVNAVKLNSISVTRKRHDEDCCIYYIDYSTCTDNKKARCLTKDEYDKIIEYYQPFS